MTLLSDVDIHEALILEWISVSTETLVYPALEDIQPNSVDLHLSPWFQIFTDTPGTINSRIESDCSSYSFPLECGKYFELKPHQFVLGSTLECVAFDDRHAGNLEGKSSLGRLGLQVHSTAGFFDAGFKGHPTLEISNMLNQSILLWPGMPVCQMAFYRLSSPASKGYSGKYSNQGAKPRSSEFWRNVWEDPRADNKPSNRMV